MFELEPTANITPESQPPFVLPVQSINKNEFNQGNDVFGSARMGWIRWSKVGDDDLKVETVSDSTKQLGLDSLKPGSQLARLIALVRDDERPKLLDHFSRCLESRANEVACLRLKNERWLELETQAQDDPQNLDLFMTVIVDVSREKRLEIENKNLNQIIDTIPSWVFLKNEEHQYVRVNPAYAAVYGLKPDGLIGKTPIDLGVEEEIAFGNPEKNISGFYADDDWVLATGQTKHISSEPIVVNGQTRYLNTIKVPVYDALNERKLVLGLSHDVTHLKEIESKTAIELRYNKTLHKINDIFHGNANSFLLYNQVCEVTFDAINCTRVGIIVNGKQEPWLMAEKSAASSHGHKNSAGKHCLSAAIQFGEQPFGVLEIERSGNSDPFSDEEKQLGQGIANHLALAIQRQQLNDEIHHQAQHDSLTDLPNRHLLASVLKKTVRACQKSNSSCAIFLLDLDGFKHINDTMGHQAGDELLLAVSRRLSNSVPDHEMLARLGGDEFALLIPELPNREYAMQSAKQLLDQFKAPFYIDDRKLFIGASLGISLFPEDANDSNSLMKHADMAMYESKSHGKNAFQIFSPTLAEKADRRHELETALRHAISEQQELSLVYQPKVCFKTRETLGVEALLRWKNPELGNISPNEFISIAEESGLILPLGSWVLKTACQDLNRWNKNLDSKLSLSVNASPMELEQQDFVHSTLRILEEYSIDPTLLELEVTETMFMHRFGPVTECLQKLRDVGVGVSVDDFGTGYSCMSYLQKLPVDTLKIDKSFVDLLDSTNEEQIDCELTIAATIVSLAKSLNLKTVAEGIETKAQANLLRQIGADMGQGFFFSRPISSDEIEELLLK